MSIHLEISRLYHISDVKSVFSCYVEGNDKNSRLEEFDIITSPGFLNQSPKNILKVVMEYNPLAREMIERAVLDGSPIQINGQPIKWEKTIRDEATTMKMA